MSKSHYKKVCIYSSRHLFQYGHTLVDTFNCLRRTKMYHFSCFFDIYSHSKCNCANEHSYTAIWQGNRIWDMLFGRLWCTRVEHFNHSISCFHSSISVHSISKCHLKCPPYNSCLFPCLAINNYTEKSTLNLNIQDFFQW